MLGPDPPRMSMTISTGTKVTDSPAAAAME